jgi:hypothetical protein
MPIKLLALCLGVMCSLMTAVALAGGWSGKTTIQRVAVRVDRTIIVAAEPGPWVNPDVCDDPSKIVLLPPDSGTAPAAYKEIYALLLGAKVSNREINVYLDGCTLIGSKTFPVFTQVAIY